MHPRWAHQNRINVVIRGRGHSADGQAQSRQVVMYTHCLNEVNIGALIAPMARRAKPYSDLPSSFSRNRLRHFP